MTSLCPCQSGLDYQNCCQPFHLGERLPESATQLMRSRYAAYVLKQIDYVINSTVPSQQKLLDANLLQEWADSTQWLGLQILRAQTLDKTHSAVEFKAFFAGKAGENNKQAHHELSLFVQIDQRWYFVDPTVPLPTMKQPCVCGSGKKFKYCCGAYL
ncbi:preprotein translocase subunit SecA [Pasteurellaceae bacterium Pebbles2]|nr:preprotein translocase subunit SecA [Pasteurellaceae bacterium Pebbles2]